MEKVTIVSNEEQTYNNSTGAKICFVNVANETKFLVVFSNNALFEKASQLKTGDTVNMDFKQKGKYLELVEIGSVIPPTEESSTIATSAKKQQQFINESQQVSIQNQVSIKSAVELVVGCGVKFKTVNDALVEVLKVAGSFNEFIVKNKVNTEEV